jgi:multidrug efflux pump subunit AcrB
VKAIQDRAMGKFMQFKDAFAFAFAPPAVLELGTATGFDVRLVDRAGLGHETLMNARNQMLGMTMQNPVVTKVRPNGLDDMPMYQIDVDQVKASESTPRSAPSSAPLMLTTSSTRAA